MSKASDFNDDMKRIRGIDFAHIGQMVEVGGDVGTIKGMNYSGNLDIVFANQLKHGSGKHNCHPTYNIKYYDQNGVLVSDFGKD